MDSILSRGYEVWPGCAMHLQNVYSSSQEIVMGCKIMRCDIMQKCAEAYP
jgi:hypothetical protein